VSDIPFVVFKGTNEMKSVEHCLNPELMDYRARPGGFDCLGIPTCEGMELRTNLI